MTPHSPQDAADLRWAAEARLRKQASLEIFPAVEADALRLFHELQVYQIELEMQNEELLRAKEQLEAARARYTDLYEFAPVGYVILDRIGNMLEINQTGTHLLAVERARLVGCRFALFLATESLPTFNTFMESVWGGQIITTCEVLLARDETGPRWLYLEGLTAADPQECRLVMVDITEHKHVMGTLRENEKQYINLFERMSDAVFIIDAEDNFPAIEYVNDIGVSLYGYSREEFQRLSLVDISAEPDKMRADITSLLTESTLPLVPLRYHKKKDGTLFPIEVASSMFVVDNRKKIIMALRDINERI